MFGFFFLGVQVFVLIVCLKTHKFDSLFFLWGFVVILSRVPNVMWHILFAGMGFVTFLYNASVYDVGLTSVEIRLSGAFDAGKYEYLLSAMSFSMWLFVLAGLGAVLNAHVTATTKATTTATLCSLVAEKMVLYDIQGARELLEGNASEGMDERLKH
eukprot:PhF_6_TR25750/c0_g1_i2/m.36298